MVSFELHGFELRVFEFRVAGFELRVSRKGAKGKGREEENTFDTDSDSDIDTEIFELENIPMQAGSPHHNHISGVEGRLDARTTIEEYYIIDLDFCRFPYRPLATLSGA